MLAIKPSPVILQSLHTNLMKQFNLVFELKNYAHVQGIKDSELKTRLEEIENNHEEDFHGQIESSAIKYLESILSSNIEFFSTDEGYMEFVYFLCVQYTRTKKIKTRVLSIVKPPPNIDFEKIWNILSHIFATNMGASLYVDRHAYQLVLLDNQSSIQFITGDQPVVNTYASGDPKIPTQQLEFYYPVSPSAAVLLTKKEKYGGDNKHLISAVEVSTYNEFIERNKYEQIYAASKSALEEYTS